MARELKTQKSCRRAVVIMNHGKDELDASERTWAKYINKLQAAVTENGVQAEAERHFPEEPITRVISVC